MSQLYMTCAHVIEQWTANRGGLKTLVFGSTKIRNQAATFSLSCEALKYESIISELLTSSGAQFAATQNRVRPALLLVMVYDLLFGHGKIEGGGQVKRLIKEYESRMRTALERLKIARGASCNQELLPPPARSDGGVTPTPRYVRVNTLLATVVEVCNSFVALGYECTTHKVNHIDLSDSAHSTYSSPSDATKGDTVASLSCSNRRFYIDAHLPHVLVFPASVDLHAHELLQSGKIVLQDKASCMPPFALVSDLLCAPLCSSALECGDGSQSTDANERGSKFAAAMRALPRWHVIDACAAPGNKTSYLAALLQLGAASVNLPASLTAQCDASLADHAKSSVKVSAAVRVDACEIDERRFSLLRDQMKRFGAQHVVSSRHCNFLALDPNDPEFGDVRMILCDPSCSSSGLAYQQVDQIIKSCRNFGSEVGGSSVSASIESAKQRENIQSLARFQAQVVKHAMSFPAVLRVSYSTCSINQEENEDVVRQVLEARPDFELIRALPAWHRRGVDVFPAADFCLRCTPGVDQTHGFFVAVFQRRDFAASTSAASADGTSSAFDAQSAPLPVTGLATKISITNANSVPAALLSHTRVQTQTAVSRMRDTLAPTEVGGKRAAAVADTLSNATPHVAADSGVCVDKPMSVPTQHAKKPRGKRVKLSHSFRR